MKTVIKILILLSVALSNYSQDLIGYNKADVLTHLDYFTQVKENVYQADLKNSSIRILFKNNVVIAECHKPVNVERYTFIMRDVEKNYILLGTENGIEFYKHIDNPIYLEKEGNQFLFAYNGL